MMNTHTPKPEFKTFYAPYSEFETGDRIAVVARDTGKTVVFTIMVPHYHTKGGAVVRFEDGTGRTEMIGYGEYIETFDTKTAWVKRAIR